MRPVERAAVGGLQPSARSSVAPWVDTRLFFVLILLSTLFSLLFAKTLLLSLTSIPFILLHHSHSAAVETHTSYRQTDIRSRACRDGLKQRNELDSSPNNGEMSSLKWWENPIVTIDVPPYLDPEQERLENEQYAKLEEIMAA